MPGNGVDAPETPCRNDPTARNAVEYLMRDDARTPVPPRAASNRRRPLHALTEFLAARFELTVADREETVAAMLARTRYAPAGYWLQLLTAMGIATLGVALDSTAVVIGAMLIAPLMTPIIALGMGLAIGSPLLVLRSVMRVVASVVIVPLGAAVVTLALPSHEMTSEISSRTSPTALDLAIACCCAIAGLYATTRPSSDRSSTAAGTAIGIALVPPLCVVGYGLGTTSATTAGGAALLFVANFSAIVLLSVVGFAALGYASVPVAALERAHVDKVEATTMSVRVAHRLSGIFASRAGRAVRIIMPVALVAVVYIPLRRALEHVTWELRVRTAVNDALRSLPGETVHSSIRIDRREVSVRVVTMAQAGEADLLRKQLIDRIAAVAPGTSASVEVSSVTDSHALERAEVALRERSVPALPVAGVDGGDAGRGLRAAREDVERVLGAWPSSETGQLLAWHLSPLRSGSDAGAQTFAITVVHVGAPLGTPAANMLERSLSMALGAQIGVRDVVLSADPLVADLANAEQWLVRVTRAMTEAQALVPADAELFACIDVPAAARGARTVRAVRTSPLFDVPRAHIEAGAQGWSFRWSTSPCARGADADADAGSDADAPDAGDSSR